MATSPADTPSPVDGLINDIIKDQQIRRIRNQTMDKLKWGALLNSISETCKFIAGPIFGIGIGAAMAASALTPLALVLLGAATACLIVGVASDYSSTRITQSGQFDSVEINAQSTARHLVHELKANNMCLTEHDQNCRTDGKKWTQAVNKPQDPALSQSPQS